MLDQRLAQTVLAYHSHHNLSIRPISAPLLTGALSWSQFKNKTIPEQAPSEGGPSAHAEQLMKLATTQ